MRRFLTLVCLLCLAIPAGISISGCTRNPGENYCNGQGYGLKITEVATITLQPATTGISLAYGQTKQITSPTATTCKNTSASVSTYTYGTTNNQLVDISPSGSICAGTWNRNTGGGIANYTICTAPNPLPTTKGMPYGTAYITASAQSVTSNPVEVYIHPAVTVVSLVGPTSCLSQNASATLDAQACYSQTVNGVASSALLCAPASVTGSSNFDNLKACALPSGVARSAIPTCGNSIGTLSYSVDNSTVASINSTTNEITAALPGTTNITATLTGVGSTAGYFSTCPPKSISLKTANGDDTLSVTQGVTENLVTEIIDTNGKTITGLSLDYQSTDPVDISVGSGGAITANYPSTASVYAVCQPSVCNPTPPNQVGFNGTGLPISSDAVKITTPGTASDYVWFASPGQSRYIVPVELISGTVGSTVKLAYVPNSLVMDRTATSIYLGSSQGLMIVNTSSGAQTKTDANVPGVVLAVAPSNATVLINDQARQQFYLYSVSSGTSTTIAGLGNAAAWTPDSKTLYITDNSSLGGNHTDTLYVYNVNTSWNTYQLPKNPLATGELPTGSDVANTAVQTIQQTPAITIPSVGAFLRGTAETVAHTWCPTGTVSGTLSYYPLGGSVTTQSDVLAATTDGNHILGAAINSKSGDVTLSDIGVKSSTQASDSFTQACKVTTAKNGTQTLSALSLSPTLDATFTLDASKVNATAVKQIIPSPVSNLAFITYTGSTLGAQLPYYVPGSGAVNYVTLTGSEKITAPLAGAFTPDDEYFFVSTAGDNKIHYISIPTDATKTAPTDTLQISPNLPACTSGTDIGCLYTGSGSIVPTTAIAVKPRSTT
jgi:hypothetical protein